MSSNACLALLLDGPMQSWGYASRFERRTTALHPTRSGILGMVAAAMGINKNPEEGSEIERFNALRIMTVGLPRNGRSGEGLPMGRLEDYHTVSRIRRASGKVSKDGTVQTYRHYLLDARFGVLMEGPDGLIGQIAKALRNPKWGVWLGRKCCIPASPVLVAAGCERAAAWAQLLQKAGYGGTEVLEEFDHVVETSPDLPGADVIEDRPVAFGNPIGERHGPRWIRRVPRRSGQKT